MQIPVQRPSAALRPLLPDLPPVDLPEGRWLELPRRGRTWLTDVPGPTPDAPTIVLLHAVGCTGQLTWFPSIPRLAERYRVITFDQRWHGRGITSERFLVSDCADDVGRRDRRARPRPPDHRRLLDGLGHRAASVAPASRRRRRADPRRQHRPLPHQRPRAGLPRRHGAGHGPDRDAVALARGQPGQLRRRRGARRRHLRHRPLGDEPVALDQPVGRRPGRRVPRPAPLHPVAVVDRRADRGRRDHPRQGAPAGPPARAGRAHPGRHGARGRLRPRRLRPGAPGLRPGRPRGGPRHRARMRDRQLVGE